MYAYAVLARPVNQSMRGSGPAAFFSSPSAILSNPLCPLPFGPAQLRGYLLDNKKGERRLNESPDRKVHLPSGPYATNKYARARGATAVRERLSLCVRAYPAVSVASSFCRKV